MTAHVLAQASEPDHPNADSVSGNGTVLGRRPLTAADPSFDGPTLVPLSDGCKTEVTNKAKESLECDTEKQFIETTKQALKDSDYTAAETSMKQQFVECADLSEGCVTMVSPSAVMDLRMLGGGVINDECQAAFDSADIPNMDLDCENGKYIDEMAEKVSQDNIADAVKAMSGALEKCGKAEDGTLKFTAQCATQVSPFVLNQLMNAGLEAMKGLMQGLGGLGKMKAMGARMKADALASQSGGGLKFSQLKHDLATEQSQIGDAISLLALQKYSAQKMALIQTMEHGPERDEQLDGLQATSDRIHELMDRLRTHQTARANREGGREGL